MDTLSQYLSWWNRNMLSSAPVHKVLICPPANAVRTDDRCRAIARLFWPLGGLEWIRRVIEKVRDAGAAGRPSQARRGDPA
jgi:hypothetical protein